MMVRACGCCFAGMTIDYLETELADAFEHGQVRHMQRRLPL